MYLGIHSFLFFIEQSVKMFGKYPTGWRHCQSHVFFFVFQPRTPSNLEWYLMCYFHESIFHRLHISCTSWYVLCNAFDGIFGEFYLVHNFIDLEPLGTVWSNEIYSHHCFCAKFLFVFRSFNFYFFFIFRIWSFNCGIFFFFFNFSVNF